MPRFFVPDPVIAQREIIVSGQEARHMQRVLRLRVGDRVDIFDGTGKQYCGEITLQGRQAVTVRILETTMPDREAPLTVMMGQGLIKGSKMDFIIQKATEMGVSELIPFVSSRSITRLEEGRMERRVSRWQRIAVESSKQCGRVVPLRIEGVRGFHEVLQRTPGGAEKIILWERAAGSLRSLFREKERRSGGLQRVYFLVGPEGGFSEEEVRQAEEAHFVSVRLGPRTLRVETAGLTFVSIIQYEWGDLG